MALKSCLAKKNVTDTAYGEGFVEGEMMGKLEGKKEVAKALKQHGVAVQVITATTGLTEQEIALL